MITDNNVNHDTADVATERLLNVETNFAGLAASLPGIAAAVTAWAADCYAVFARAVGSSSPDGTAYKSS